jgi:hypothetical protein
VYVAPPEVTFVGVVVHENPPPPLLAARLSVVDESEVSTLLLASSSETSTEKVAPAAVVDGGDVVKSSWLAAPGLTVTIGLLAKVVELPSEPACEPAVKVAGPAVVGAVTR